MRLGRRTRAGLSLTLGVLIGLGLVVLPGILAAPSQTSTTFGSNPRVTSPVQAGQSGSLGNQPTGASSGFTAGSLLILVGLVLSPAIALSFLARYWMSKQAKDRLGSKN
ncbi:hypothetical protein E6H34_01420 [Candidatus Bathyarchaeota archaeon]|nr:MAG: hypothetical protein E6H34_01420 [Candidatus Bathyarchaeota archaeon]